jgi:sugar lactone lactonase YvrE
MTAGPDDSIYVADETREEVLRWSPGKGFCDVAGDGHRGFSGDGGQATKASFDFSWASAVAVGRDGTLYISDTGNGGIRAVTANGIVHTVVGLARPNTPRALAQRSPYRSARCPSRAL